MNLALSIQNWKEGGNSYVLKGNPKNKWVGFQQTVIDQLRESFSDNFNIVIWTDEHEEGDYYCIPFSAVGHLFTEEHKTTGKYPNRWTAVILDHLFVMHGNSTYSVNVANYYGVNLLPKSSVVVEADYYIENAKAEINIRVGQSKFRKGVLANFNNKCAVTGISESLLLRASHIVPWSHKKDYRGDITNGIALYVEIDALFDEGYISFSDDYVLIVTSKLDELSPELKAKVMKLKGARLSNPKKPIGTDYLKYHRDRILKK